MAERASDGRRERPDPMAGRLRSPTARRATMYIGIGAVIAIILIILLLAFVF